MQVCRALLVSRVACCCRGLGVVLSSLKTHKSDIDSLLQFFIDGSRTYSLEERKEKYFQSVGEGTFPRWALT